MSEKCKLLCIDDEPIACEIFKGIFEDDYDVALGTSGEQALALAQDHKPDIVILDAVMPDIDGWEVCRRLKQNPHTAATKIIMVSAHAIDADHRQKGFDAGADDYLIKPYIHSDLLAKVRVWQRVQEVDSELEKRFEELHCLTEQLEKAKEQLQLTVDDRTRALIETNKKLHNELEQHKRDEQEKEKLREQLIHSRKMEAIGQLAGGIAHDFNNLLGGILGSADLIKARQGADSPLHRRLDTIISCCNRGAHLVSQLLTFARKKVFFKSPIDINQTMRETISFLEETLDKRIQIKTNLKAHLSIVDADADQLHAAFLNIAINARDAMPDGGILAVETKNEILDKDYCAKRGLSAPPGEYVLVLFRDTGVGMLAETKARIFEPFFTTKPSGKGTGLGLASVYGCIHEHKGDIHIESAPGAGTTFTLYLPNAAQAAENTPIVSQSNKLRPASGGALVIDDEQAMLEVSAEYLELLGYAATCFNNGVSAMKYIEETPNSIDLVVLDMIMPIMDGAQCFSKIRSLLPSVPVIVVSGIMLCDEAKDILSQPRTVFLQKPFDMATMQHALSRLELEKAI